MVKNTRKIPHSKGRELTPEGVHNARLVGFYDLGTQKTKYKGAERETRQCNLAFEMIDLEASNGEPLVEYKLYTYSDSPRGNFMKDLANWQQVKDGNFDPQTLLDKPAIVTVKHNETENGTYCQLSIGAVTAKIAKSMDKAREPLRAFFLDEDGFDQKVFKALPQHIQTKISASPEYVEIYKTMAEKELPFKKTSNGVRSRQDKIVTKDKGVTKKIPAIPDKKETARKRSR